jgi:hypothetical protein
MRYPLGNGKPQREREKFRAIIIANSLVPDVVIHHRRKFWDGISMRTETGDRVLGINFQRGILPQMKRMAREGFWGNLRGTIVDWGQHGKIRASIDGRLRGGPLLNVELWQPPKSRTRKGVCQIINSSAM